MRDSVRGIVAALWKGVDSWLASVAARLQAWVRALRWVRALLVVGLGVLVFTALLAVGAAAGWVPLRWFLVGYAISTLFLLVPLVALLAVVNLPLQARSVVRLIDRGYPENFREIAVRVVARKLHDESIASEELLVETAVNEFRKLGRRMRAEEPSPPAP
ncbi:MAG: hypothetical protein ACYDBQ_07285 [Thermoplasmatota archaeon]